MSEKDEVFLLVNEVINKLIELGKSILSINQILIDIRKDVLETASKISSELIAGSLASIHAEVYAPCWCDYPEEERKELSIVTRHHLAKIQKTGPTIWLPNLCPVCGKPKDQWREK